MNKRTKFNIGFRLFVAVTLLLCGQFLFGIAALASIHNWHYNPVVLGTGLTPEQKAAQDEMLTAVKKEVTMLVSDSFKGYIKEDEVQSRIDKLNKTIADMTADQHKALKKSFD